MRGLVRARKRDGGDSAGAPYKFETWLKTRKTERGTSQAKRLTDALTFSLNLLRKPALHARGRDSLPLMG